MASTTELIKELRERTGAGIMECKRAIDESNSDLNAAEKLLKEWGLTRALPKLDKVDFDENRLIILTARGKSTADRLKIFPTKVDGDATRATVRTEVKRDNGDRVSVNYYMRKTAEGWKAWDVVIDGISYVNSYREDFGPQIESQGIDAVIKRLESGEKPEAIGKQTK